MHLVLFVRSRPLIFKCTVDQITHHFVTTGSLMQLTHLDQITLSLCHYRFTHAVDSLYPDLSSHFIPFHHFSNLFFCFTLAAGSLHGLPDRCAGCSYAIPMAISIPDTSATSHNSADLSNPTDTATFTAYGSSHASHYATFPTANMAAYDPTSYATISATTCTTFPLYHAFSLHFTFTGLHATLFSSNRLPTSYTNSSSPAISTTDSATYTTTMNGAPTKEFGNLFQLFHRLRSHANSS